MREYSDDEKRTRATSLVAQVMFELDLARKVFREVGMILHADMCSRAIGTLKAADEEPHPDTARLDWLAANGAHMGSAIEMDHGVFLDMDNPTLRDAIDDAMREQRVYEERRKDARPKPRTGPWTGGVSIWCPVCSVSGAMDANKLQPTITTERALRTEQMPDGLRFVGVPCDVCLQSFTVEMRNDEATVIGGGGAAPGSVHRGATGSGGS